MINIEVTQKTMTYLFDSSWLRLYLRITALNWKKKKQFEKLFHEVNNNNDSFSITTNKVMASVALMKSSNQPVPLLTLSMTF